MWFCVLPFFALNLVFLTILHIVFINLHLYTLILCYAYCSALWHCIPTFVPWMESHEQNLRLENQDIKMAAYYSTLNDNNQIIRERLLGSRIPESSALSSTSYPLFWCLLPSCPSCFPGFFFCTDFLCSDVLFSIWRVQQFGTVCLILCQHTPQFLQLKSAALLSN